MRKIWIHPIVGAYTKMLSAGNFHTEQDGIIDKGRIKEVKRAIFVKAREHFREGFEDFPKYDFFIDNRTGKNESVSARAFVVAVAGTAEYFMFCPRGLFVHKPVGIASVNPCDLESTSLYNYPLIFDAREATNEEYLNFSKKILQDIDYYYAKTKKP